MLRILANDGIESSAIQKLESHGHTVDANHYEGEALVEQLKNSDVLVVRSATKVRVPLIDQVAGSKLKLVIRAGVGIDNIDFEYAESKGITVRNTPNSSSASVAELAIGHMFNLARFIHISNVTMRNGEWNKKHYEGTEIAGKTLGLIGFGRIAREVAVRAKALGMKVIYTDVVGKLIGFDDYPFVSLEELLKTSDYISLHIPYDKEAGPTITKKQFELMKDGVYIINCARGGVVCEDALLMALDSGKVAGAGLDVFEEEPTKREALYKHPKISMTPHIGGSTAEAQERIGSETIDVILNFFK